MGVYRGEGLAREDLGVGVAGEGLGLLEWPEKCRD